MLEWYLHLPLANKLIGLLLLISFCIVMHLCLRSFSRSPIGWYRGFQSTPIFQISMWVGALPLFIPAIVLLVRRKKALKVAPLIGNLRSKIFHKPHCEYQQRIYSDLLRYPLASREEAKARGFRPCNWCS